MDIYLLRYNNYYNRRLKIERKTPVLSDYTPYVLGGASGIIHNVNFNPRDGINTSVVIGSASQLWMREWGDADYLLEVDPDTSESYEDVDVNKAFDNLLYKIDGLNELLLYQKNIVDIMNNIKKVDAKIFTLRYGQHMISMVLKILKPFSLNKHRVNSSLNSLMLLVILILVFAFQ